MRLYNRVIKYISQAVLCMLVFSSCVGDRLEAESVRDKKFSRGVIYFRIMAADGAFSRASGDLENGSEAEHIIGTTGNYALFFDKNGNLSTISPLVLPTMNDPVDDQHQREVIYGSRVETEDELDLPESCLLILNGERIYDQLMPMIGRSLDDILGELVWTENDPHRIGWNDEGYFTMTNAVYLDGESVVTAVRISPDMVQGEGTFDPQKVLIIHVERMLSKFNFRIEEGHPDSMSGFPVEFFQPSTTPDIVLFDKFETGEDGDTAPHYTATRWCIEITGWGINALENSSYLFKKNSLTYRDADEASDWTSWNDKANYRSYWAEDLTYENPKYPWQYRDVGYESAENIPFYSATGADADGVTKLKNYSFEDLDLYKKEEPVIQETHFNRSVYVPESTFNAYIVKTPFNDKTKRSNHDNRDEMLAASHLLVGGELQLETGDASTSFAPLDVYRDRSGFFYLTERECFAVLVHAFNQLLTSQKTMDFTYYKWNKTIEDFNSIENFVTTTAANGDKITSKPSNINDSENAKDYDYQLYWSSNGSDFVKLSGITIAEMTDEEFALQFGGMAIGELPGGDGQRLPWPEKGLLAILNSNTSKSLDDRKLDIYERDIQVALTETIFGDYLRKVNENDIKSLLYEWVGAVDHFKDGKMYYACGIEHFPDRVVMNGDKPKIDEENRKESLTGRFGAVRNNWYQFSLKAISGLGVPVDDVNQPIVPDRASPNDQVNVTVTILDWHNEESTTPSVSPI